MSRNVLKGLGLFYTVMQHFVLEVQTFRFTDALKIVKALELLTLTDPAEA